MPCDHCPKPLHKHDRRRVYDDRGPPGSYHYEYYNCPGGFDASIMSGLAGVGSNPDSGVGGDHDA
jgi:hypothetical protein